MIKIGTSDTTIYAGDDVVKYIYVGTTQVYSNDTPTPPTPTPSGTSVPFTVEVLSGGTWYLGEDETNSVIMDMEYQINGGEWISGGYFDEETGEYICVTAITFNAGDTIAFRGNEYGGSIQSTDYFISPESQYGGLTVPYNVYGNIMSLYAYDFSGFTVMNDYNYANFYRMFSGDEYNNPNVYLMDASELLLPATTLLYGCYEGMFANCVNITSAPELPATTLAERCYYGMFQGCTSITTAPDLLAEQFEDYCYNAMFYNCQNLNSIKIATYDLSNCSDCPVYSMLEMVAQNGVIYVTQDAYTVLTNDMIDDYDYELLPEGWTYSIYNEE